LGSRQKRKITR